MHASAVDIGNVFLLVVSSDRAVSVLAQFSNSHDICNVSAVLETGFLFSLEITSGGRESPVFPQTEMVGISPMPKMKTSCGLEGSVLSSFADNRSFCDIIYSPDTFSLSLAVAHIHRWHLSAHFIVPFRFCVKRKRKYVRITRTPKPCSGYEFPTPSFRRPKHSLRGLGDICGIMLENNHSHMI